MAKPGTPPVIGIIGGSGIDEIDGLSNLRWEEVASPVGRLAAWPRYHKHRVRLSPAQEGDRLL